MAKTPSKRSEILKRSSGMVPFDSDAQASEYKMIVPDPLEELCRKTLIEIGEDPDRDGLRDTPKRWAKAMRELTSGYTKDHRPLLEVQFEEKYDQIILMRDIPFYSLCEHHLLSFFGTITVGYIPKKKVFGASKLIRLVDIFSKRLQIQERLGRQITGALVKAGVKGAAVVIRARHLCMECRGVMRHGQIFETSDDRGCFRNDPVLKNQWLQLIKR